jgi:hypothetical protein
MRDQATFAFSRFLLVAVPRPDGAGLIVTG